MCSVLGWEVEGLGLVGWGEVGGGGGEAGYQRTGRKSTVVTIFSHWSPGYNVLVTA